MKVHPSILRPETTNQPDRKLMIANFCRLIPTVNRFATRALGEVVTAWQADFLAAARAPVALYQRTLAGCQPGAGACPQPPGANDTVTRGPRPAPQSGDAAGLDPRKIPGAPRGDGMLPAPPGTRCSSPPA